jgi:hypothetical protein
LAVGVDALDFALAVRQCHYGNGLLSIIGASRCENLSIKPNPKVGRGSKEDQVSYADLDRLFGLIQINTVHRKITDGDYPHYGLEVAMTTVAGHRRNSGKKSAPM